MKRSLFFSILGLCAFVAQTHAQADSTKQGIRIGLTSSLDYGYRIISKSNTDPSTITIYNFFKEQEIPDLGYSIGLTSSIPLQCLSKKPNRQTSLDVSVAYVNRNYKTKKFDLTNTAGEKIGDLYYNYTNTFLSLPIGLHHQLGRIGTCEFRVGASVIPEYFMGLWSKANFNLPDTYDVNDSPTKVSNSDFLTFQTSAGIDVGLRQNWGRFAFELNPNFKIALFNQAKDTPVNRRLWTAGLEFRVLFGV